MGEHADRINDDSPDPLPIVEPAPFIKSAGGKRQLLPQILPLVPKTFGRYFEPFVGGGALFFKLRADGWKGPATLGDANGRLVGAYRAVRDELPVLILELRAFARVHSEKRYYFERKQTYAMRASAAAQFIYLNRTCFNGLWRVNRKGEFNVPLGSYKNPTICDEVLLEACSRALRGVGFFSADFAEALKGARKGDFCYIDPPYEPINEGSFVKYTANGFTRVDQERLRDVALGLKRKGVKVLLSNSSSPYIRQLYKTGFEIIEVEARRAINSKGAKRGPVTEILIR